MLSKRALRAANNRLARRDGRKMEVADPTVVQERTTPSRRATAETTPRSRHRNRILIRGLLSLPGRAARAPVIRRHQALALRDLRPSIRHQTVLRRGHLCTNIHQSARVLDTRGRATCGVVATAGVSTNTFLATGPAQAPCTGNGFIAEDISQSATYSTCSPSLLISWPICLQCLKDATLDITTDIASFTISTL